MVPGSKLSRDFFSFLFFLFILEEILFSYIENAVYKNNYISEDESVWKSVLDRKPLALAYPEGQPIRQLKDICSDILLKETEFAGKNKLLSQLTL